ncbi:MAG: hypothetical protein JKY54_16460 [Flavobacteriales bacterium]|nr:hypothetical protein [Flavobacteriales bacterium]
MSNQETTIIDESKLHFQTKVQSKIIGAVSNGLTYPMHIGPEGIIKIVTTAPQQTFNGVKYEPNLTQSSNYDTHTAETGDFHVTCIAKTYKDPGKYSGIRWAPNQARSHNALAWNYCGTMPRIWVPGVMGFKPKPLTHARNLNKIIIGGVQIDTKIDPYIIDNFLRMHPKEQVLQANKGFTCAAVDNTMHYIDNSTGFPFMRQELCDNYTPKLRGEGNALSSINADSCNVLGMTENGRYIQPTSVKFYIDETGVEIDQFMADGIPIPSVDGVNAWYSDSTNQTLREELIFRITEPIFSDIFHQMKNNSTLISHISQMTVDSTWISDLSEVIASAYPRASLDNYAHLTDGTLEAAAQIDVATRDAARNATQLVRTMGQDNIKISVSIDNLKLEMFEVRLQKQIVKSSTCRIPFIKARYHNFPSVRDITWEANGTTKQLISVPTIKLDRVPNHVVIYGESYNFSDKQYKNTRGCSTVRIHNVNIQFAGNEGLCARYSERDLYEMTKENGFEQYGWNDVIGYDKYVNVQTPVTNDFTVYNADNATINPIARKVVPQYAYDPNKAPGRNIDKVLKHISGCGTRIVLSMGGDIPLPPLLVPGSHLPSGENFSFECQIASDDDTQWLRLNYIFLYDSELEIANDTGNLKENRFKESDVLMAYQLLRSRGDFTLQSQYLMGGGLFSTVARSLKSFLPKLTNIVNTVKDVHKAVAPIAKVASKGLQGINNGQSDGSRFIDAVFPNNVAQQHITGY